MSAPTCARLFEVEAMRDGRLSGAERTKFETHLETCAACAREARALDDLAEAARATGDDVLDELHVRRERTRLLAALDASQVNEVQQPRRWLVPAIAAVALGIGVFVSVRLHVPPSPARDLATATVIQADGTARYSKHAEESRERIVLEQGALRIQVKHTGAPRQRALLVTLPDGELEDTGTTFTVRAENGKTSRVAVEEGSVVLRLRAQAAIVLGAGQSWSADAAAPTTSTTASTSVEVSSAPPPASAAPLGSSQGIAAPTAPDPSKDFREATAELNAGDPRRAAERFARFLETHAKDPRAEDAAYLRVVAFHRTGDESATKAAARAYLTRYPAGFRRVEVEKLASP